ncbi:MAG: LPS export ABC transporter periplasmic protein LptC [Paludibacteraceae bacterium]
MVLSLRHNGYMVSALLVLAVCCFTACRRGEGYIPSVEVVGREAMPVLDANKVSTLISDSGVTRYRINAEQWQIYDKAQPSYWDFPRGIYIEKFDEELNVNASLRSDHAQYDEDAQIWRLEGNVYAVNQEGEIFETPLLFWNQRTERVYSDSAIKITRATSIINGVGFESNQEMSQYTIKNPTGFFPINEE